jgi:uncharacterized membrane protein HdeD (DUF308 family)
MKVLVADVADSLDRAHKMWGWYLALGVAMIALGAYAITYGMAATLASIVVLGAVCLAAGILRVAAAFQSHGAGHFALFLMLGILDIIVGWMLMQHAVAGALVVTLLLALLFVFEGIYGLVGALWLQFPYYGWVAFSGIVSLVLGILLWAEWPISATWFIGFAVGLNFIMSGVAWSALALKLKAA